MASSKTTVDGVLEDATGSVVASEYVYFRLKQAGADNDVTPDTVYSRGRVEGLTNASGELKAADGTSDFTLWVNGESDIQSIYEITTKNRKIDPTEVIIPASATGGSISIAELMINHAVSGSTAQQSTVLADAKTYTDELAADPSTNASFSVANWRGDLGLATDDDVIFNSVELTDGTLILSDGSDTKIIKNPSSAQIDFQPDGSTAMSVSGSSIKAETEVQLQGNLIVLDPTGDSSIAAAVDNNVSIEVGATELVAMSTGRFRIVGGFATSTTSVSSTSYTTLITDNTVLVDDDTAGSTVTITLLAAATAGNGFTLNIVKEGSTADVVVTGIGTLTEEGESITLKSDGTTYRVV